MNGYAYADNNPSTNSDPTGTRCWPGEAGECHNGDGVDRRPNADGHGYTVHDSNGRPTARSGNSTGGGWVAGHPSGPTREQILEQKAKEMRARVAAAQGRIKNALLSIVKIAADELGITAGIDCVTKGDLGACGETVLNIAMSFVGGVAAKILSKYGAPWKWAKGGRLAKRLWKLGGEVVSAVKDFVKAGKEARAAERALNVERLAAKAARVCNSFVAGTKVRLVDGSLKDISAIRPGDKVLAIDARTGKSSSATVSASISGTSYVNLAKILVAGKRGERGGTVVSTEHHLFRDKLSGQWVRADQIEKGQQLETVDREGGGVVGVASLPGHPRVFDITVTDLHNFYVMAGTVAVLVHNSGPGECKISGPYHRVASKTQTAEDMGNIVESGELWGRTARGGGRPAVQAYPGPLPEGKVGFEFYTEATPSEYPWTNAGRMKPGFAYAQWHAGNEGVRLSEDEDFAMIDIILTRVTYPGIG